MRTENCYKSVKERIDEEGSVRLRETFKRNQIEMMNNLIYLQQSIPNDVVVWDELKSVVKQEYFESRIPYLVGNAGVKTLTEMIWLIRDEYRYDRNRISTVTEYWDAFEETIKDIAEELNRNEDVEIHETSGFIHSKLQPFNSNEFWLIHEQAADEAVEYKLQQDLQNEEVE